MTKEEKQRPVKRGEPILPEIEEIIDFIISHAGETREDEQERTETI